MHRTKFWCETCDHVAKASGGAVCPFCRIPMMDMGKRWRPGKKGKRARTKHMARAQRHSYWWSEEAKWMTPKEWADRIRKYQGGN